MKIHLHIDRLVLDGIAVNRTQGGKLRNVVEQELTRLLTHGGLSPQLSTGGAIPSLRAGNLRINATFGPAEIGERVANALYHGIGSKGESSSLPFTPAAVHKMNGGQRQAAVVKGESKTGSGAEKITNAGPPTDAGDPVNLDAGNPSLTPLDAPKPAAPAGAAWKAGVHVVPTFTVTESEGTRSNTDPATTDVDDPTFTGDVAVDTPASMWRYQLKSVEGKGRINFVYYTKDHYPAPTPNDDSGDLSNVNQGNWKDVVKDLEDHKTGAAGNWSAYRRTQLHERYHWGTEWQGAVKTELTKTENSIEKEGVPFATAPDAAAAKSALEPKAKKIFDDGTKAARDAYNALGDSPGDPPYVAGSAGATDLATRIKNHAQSKKWPGA